MKKFSILMMLVCFAMAAVAQPGGVSSPVADAIPQEETKVVKPNVKDESNPNAPEFQWDEEGTHDFGSIAKGSEAVSHKYWFTNVGQEDLIIEKVDKTCGCTVPGWSKEPVAPGEKGWVEAKFVSTNRPGNFTKTIKVHSNAKTQLKLLNFKVVVDSKEATPTQPVAPKSIFSPN